jgi:hypothetical protein
MTRFDNITSYFMSFTQVHDHLATIWEKFDCVELVTVEMNGFPNSWKSFVT